MKIYFLRHGHATWPHWEGRDNDRPLTEKGREDAQRVAKFLDHAGAKPDTILTSPLPRALQTAEIVAQQLGMRVVEERALEPGFSLEKLSQILKSVKRGDVMVVGHESDFSEIIGQLTGGEVVMAKGGVACIELEEDLLRAHLLWLIIPKLLRER